MKKVLAMVLALVISVGMVSAVAFAEEFVGSVTASKTTLVEVEGATDGTVAVIVDANGNVVAEIGRGSFIIVDSNDKETEANKDAKARINGVIDQIDNGNVAGLMSADVIAKLADAGISAENLVAGVIFDVTYDGELKEGEEIKFSVKNPEISAMQATDLYTGKIVILQKNDATGEFEVLNAEGENVFDGGSYSVDGDIASFKLSHLCVVVISSELTQKESPNNGAGFDYNWVACAAIVVVAVVAAAVTVKSRKLLSK
ncbi:MAG: hypothetical protein J5874_02505 [Oscillospiraceae bacterium]|nr:hypothetical protein [Oscillospiraceae bacterium]